MGRLIDADDLKKIIDKKEAWVIELIDEQPTAYDVDKVVEQLDAYITKIVGRKSKMYQTIIEIVKRGGVDD